MISSLGADVRQDISPKGDSPGFVEVHDDRTFIIPDRLGNHRLDPFENLRVDPRLGLLFLIPGHTESLRFSGTGRIASDDILRTPLAVNGPVPALVLVISVEQVFMHCSKSVHCATRETCPESGCEIMLQILWIEQQKSATIAP